MNSVPIGVLICAAAARLLLVPLLVTRSKVADMRGCVAVYVLNRFDADKSGSLDHSDLALLLAEEETPDRRRLLVLPPLLAATAMLTTMPSIPPPNSPALVADVPPMPSVASSNSKDAEDDRDDRTDDEVPASLASA